MSGGRFWTRSSRCRCPGTEAHLARLRLSKLVGVPWSKQEEEQEMRSVCKGGMVGVPWSEQEEEQEMRSVCEGGMGSLGFVLSGMRSH